MKATWKEVRLEAEMAMQMDIYVSGSASVAGNDFAANGAQSRLGLSKMQLGKLKNPFDDWIGEL